MDVRFSGAFSPRSDLEGGGGVSRASWSGTGDVHVPIAQHLIATAGFSYTNEFYNFSGHPHIAGSDDPWSQVSVGGLSAGLFTKINSHWSAFGGFRVTSAGETGADLGQTFTYGGSIGAGYRVSDRLSVGLAIAAQSRLEDNPVVLPFPAFNYVLPVGGDKWQIFSGGGADSGGIGGTGTGVEVGLSYRPNSTWALSAGVSGLGLTNDFRLKSSSPISNGVVQDRFTQLVLAMNCRPVRNLSLHGFAGMGMPGKLKVLSSGSSVVYTEDDSLTPVVGLSVDFRF